MIWSDLDVAPMPYIAPVPMPDMAALADVLEREVGGRTSMTDCDESLHILQHALGLDEYGQGRPYRNHYVIGEGGGTWDLWMAHVETGRAIRHEPREIFGGRDSYCFTVTELGKAYVRERSPKPPKVSRSQKRYREFLEADSGLPFFEWLRKGGRHA